MEGTEKTKFKKSFPTSINSLFLSQNNVEKEVNMRTCNSHCRLLQPAACWVTGRHCFGQKMKMVEMIPPSSLQWTTKQKRKMESNAEQQTVSARQDFPPPEWVLSQTRQLLATTHCKCHYYTFRDMLSCWSLFWFVDVIAGKGYGMLSSRLDSTFRYYRR